MTTVIDFDKEYEKIITQLKNECTIFQYETEIIDRLNKHKICALNSTNGSGKTTAVPFIIYEAFYNSSLPRQVKKKKLKILCIVPSRAICWCMYNKFQNNFVGIRMRQCNINPNAPIIYTTYGTLSKIYDESPQFLDEISMFLWDEIHELVNMTLEKLRIQCILKKYNHINHLFMSATFTQDIIESTIDYKFSQESFVRFQNETKKFSITEITLNLSHVLNRSIEEAAENAFSYYYANYSGSSNPVLIFIPCIGCAENLLKLLKEAYPDYLFFTAHSEKESDELEHIISLITNTNITNKIIVIATAIFNSGITIPGVHVIDLGLEVSISKNKNNECKKNNSITDVAIINSSLSVHEQRRGRTGRTENGVYINANNNNLSTIDTNNKISEIEYLHRIFLNLKYEKNYIFESYLLKFEMIKENNTITELGKLSIKCNIDPIYVKLINTSKKFWDSKYTEQIIAIIVFLDIDKLFNNSVDNAINNNRLELLKITKGDLLIGAYLYNQTQIYTFNEICTFYGIYKKKFVNACNLVKTLCEKIKIIPNEDKSFNASSLRKIIVKSNILNLAKRYDKYFDYSDSLDEKLLDLLPRPILAYISTFIKPYNISSALISPFIHKTYLNTNNELFNNVLYAKLTLNLKKQIVISGLLEI